MISFFCQLLKHMSQHIITLEKLQREDYFRAQVQLPEKLVWAVLYNPLSQRYPEVAGSLRDSFAGAIQGRVLEAVRKLVYSDDGYRWFLENWVKVNTASDALPEVQGFVKRVFGYALLDNRRYAELLRDNRWTEKRLRILGRDNFTCTVHPGKFYRESGIGLHVHHASGYRRDVKPWDYEDHELLTVCEVCHAKIHGKTSWDVELGQ